MLKEKTLYSREENRLNLDTIKKVEIECKMGSAVKLMLL